MVKAAAVALRLWKLYWSKSTGSWRNMHISGSVVIAAYSIMQVFMNTLGCAECIYFDVTTCTTARVTWDLTTAPGTYTCGASICPFNVADRLTQTSTAEQKSALYKGSLNSPLTVAECFFPALIWIWKKVPSKLDPSTMESSSNTNTHIQANSCTV